MKWGEDLPSLLQMAEDGQTVPALLSRPILDRRWTYTREVYETLRGSRRYTMGGAANIPFSEFAAYAKHLNLPLEHGMELWVDVRLMDDLYLSERKARQESKTGS